MIIPRACALFWLLSTFYQIHTHNSQATVLTIGLVILFWWVYKLQDRFEDETLEFFLWLKENEEALLAEEENVIYKGQEISLQTELTQFKGGVSLFVMERYRSSFFLTTDPRRWAAAYLVSLFTLLFGPWSVKGIYYTIKYNYRNLRGGDKVQLQTLLSQIAGKDAAAVVGLAISLCDEGFV